MKKILLALIVITGNVCLAQHQNTVPAMQSPNAAGLGTFGNIDITAFNGLANIGVDVFSLQEGDIIVDAKLRYYSGGVKPSSHPGWVGQNWSLNVGSVVTRKVNGGVDEVASSHYSNDKTKLSYFHHYALLDDNNWNTTAFIQSKWPNNANATNRPVMPVLAPDEFMFSLPGGASGSFFLNHKGKWIVKSKGAADLKIEVSLNASPYVLVNNANGVGGHGILEIEIESLIYSIVITDHSGFKYTFGNAADAIELSRPPRTVSREFNEDIVANAWYLTKIESPKGNVVNFEYQRKGNQYVQNITYPSAVRVSFTNAINAAGFFNNVSGGPSFSAQVVTPTYLKSITGTSFKINFDIAETTELKYSYSPGAFLNFNFNYSDLEIQDIESPIETINGISKWYKLRGITVEDPNNGGTVREKYTFEYNDNPNERLFLRRFRKVNLTSPGDDAVYKFFYNTTPLPGYNVMQNDRWGYYNGIQFPLAINGMTESQISGLLVMVPAKAQAGILTSIQYPTRGTTTFIYQPNEYSHVLQKSGNTTVLANQSGTGGGLRIHKIQNTDDFGATYTTEYQYVNTATGTSSGILAGNKRIHHTISLASPTAANIDAYDINDYDELNYTEGRDVVYSEVKRINPDGSYTIYKYSNSDNVDYIDQAPTYVYSDAYVSNDVDGYTRTSTLSSSNSNPFTSHDSRELERGQLMSEEDFNSSGTTVRLATYTYNEESSRYDDFVRSYDNYSLVASSASGNGFVGERYFQAVKIYTYYPYPKTKTETLYDPESGTSFTTSTEFSYALSSHRQVKTTERYNSENELTIIENIYNKDIVDQAASLTGLSTDDLNNLTAMYSDKNMIVPVQVNTTTDGGTTSQERYLFKSNYQLDNVQMSTKDNPLETRVVYNQYDAKGNVLSYQKSSDIKTAYIYDNNYRIAEIANAAHDAVAYSSFETNHKGYWTYEGGTEVADAAVTGSRSLVYNAGTVAQKTGLSTSMSYIVSYWSRGGSLTVTTSMGGSVTPKNTYAGINGWTYYQFEISGGTSVTITAGAPGNLDELRLYPSDSRMITYTHLPLVGISSITDVNDVTSYYEYDGLNRLILIRDEARNIVKKYTYNYKQ